MTPYLQSKLRRKYRREFKQLDALLREQGNISAALLCEKFNWSPSKARDILWTCEILGLLKMNELTATNT